MTLRLRHINFCGDVTVSADLVASVGVEFVAALDVDGETSFQLSVEWSDAIFGDIQR